MVKAEVPVGTPNGPLDLVARYAPRRVGAHLAVGLAAWQTVTPLAAKIRVRHRERTTYTITVPGLDEVYPDLHEWVLSLIPEDARRALIAETGQGRSLYGNGLVTADDQDGCGPRRSAVRLRYDGSRTQQVKLDGHDIEVEVCREDIPGGRDKIPENWRLILERIIFRTRSAEGRDAVVAHIDRLLETKRKKIGPPPFMLANRWGSEWDRRDDLPARTLDSIILRRGQLERLVDDLGEFLSSESDYRRRCLPWHRGYLLHGAPGTGKSSVAKALAHHYGLPLYYLPLGDLKEDAALMNLVARVRPRSMLLLEDVDVFHAATVRDDEGTVTLSALLNALDGVWTPHGLITVLTTNDRSALDSALIRPGRVDLDEEFLPLDVDQANRLGRWFYGRPSPRFEAEQITGRSPADLIGVMTRHKTDPAAVAAELAALSHL